MMIVCLRPELAHIPWADDVSHMSEEIKDVMEVRRDALATAGLSSSVSLRGDVLGGAGSAEKNVVGGGDIFAEEGSLTAGSLWFGNVLRHCAVLYLV